MTREHILVVHRWRDHHARYADYLDHAAHRVSYVTTALGAESVPPTAADVVVVAATDDLAQLRAAVDRLGRPDRVVALNEGDLDAAAALRDELGCPGQGPDALAPFRDKLTMVTAVAAAGVPVPPTAAAPDTAAVLAFADDEGWPVVVKPRRGTASRGVRVLRGPADLAGADLTADLAAEPHLVQAHVPHEVLHVDGLWTGEALGPWRVSRYVNTCREFTEGVALGSVESDDDAVRAAAGSLAARVGAALGDGPWVFHLEAFAERTPEGVLLTFLEAGARVGGAEIPFLWREVHGVDLMAAAVDIQLGRAPVCADPGLGGIGGWLLVPVPVPAPCVVVESGLDLADGPYAAVVPAEGSVIPRVGGYEHVGARFRFSGPTSAEVEAAVGRTLAALRLRCAPVPEPVPEPGWQHVVEQVLERVPGQEEGMAG
ncbi:ATP-grasp domain-containing protein [Saccharothrix lopnurensis]|uniref:Acetyl-CoA carboxylase biotin carboxylase subunit family protein n=1 Tax=Saccharothrix lopnurensis TaxID=1670621 RepID=A0ABW1NZ37_9PSEU